MGQELHNISYAFIVPFSPPERTCLYTGRKSRLMLGLGKSLFLTSKDGIYRPMVAKEYLSAIVGKMGSTASFLESTIQPRRDVSCDVEDLLLPCPERGPRARTALVSPHIRGCRSSWRS